MASTPGGFGGSSALESVLATCRPDLAHWPTSNSEHCTGDALKLGLLTKLDQMSG